MKKTDRPVTVLMSAIGGYGYYYLKELQEKYSPEQINLAGVIDPFADKYDYTEKLKQAGTLIYSEMEDFYKNGNSADLAVIVSPIHYHIPQSITALKYGSYVLCDKPLSATVPDVDELIQVRDTVNKWVMVGYQWCYTEAIQNLKRDIMQGIYGRPKRFKNLCFWTRDDAYYHRNDWAGKIADFSGLLILDSPANNAMAHFLQLLLYLSGQEVNRAAEPLNVSAEVFRANDIENYDTIASRVITTDAVEILFYASHTTAENYGPVFNLEFEHAIVSYGEKSPELIASKPNGEFIKSYGFPEKEPHFRKLHIAIDNINNPPQIVCGPEAVRSHTVCINKIQESIGRIVPFPPEKIIRDEIMKRFWVIGLQESLIDCYNLNFLPSENKK